MIRRSAYPDGSRTGASPPRAMPEPGFVNPWAECWGSASSSPPSQGQMADRRQSEGRQMEAAAVELSCDEVDAPPAKEGSLVRVIPVINNKGLHARASARFVQTVEGFDADVRVSRCGETVGGLSIMGLMMLAAARGTTITVETSGAEAHACMDAIEALLADKFGEEC
jgi:phosphocarrier protein HPr